MMIKKIISMAFVLIFFLSLMTVQAETVAYTNNFENGTIPENLLSGGLLSVITEPENPTNHVLCLNADGFSILNLPISKTSGGIVSLSYRIQFYGMGGNILYLPILTSDNQRIITPMYHQGGLAINNGGTMKYFRTYYENNWYDFQIVIDTEALMYDVYVNGNKICSRFTFSDAVLSDIDGMKLAISSGHVYLDDINVTRLSDSTSRSVLFKSLYAVDNTNHTIGRLPYHTTREAFLHTLTPKNSVRFELSGSGMYINNGDNLIVYDDLYNTSQAFSMVVRNISVSRSFLNQYRNSFVLKSASSYYYENSQMKSSVEPAMQKINNQLYVNTQIFNQTDGYIPVAGLKSKYGYNVKTYSNEYAVISNQSFYYNSRLMENLFFDIKSLY